MTPRENEPHKLYQHGRLVGYCRRGPTTENLDLLPAKDYARRFDVHAWLGRFAWERATGVKLEDCDSVAFEEWK